MARASSGEIRVKTIERLLETNITGTFDLDYDLYETFNLTLIANTTLTESNLPTSGVDTKVMVIRITGNFALTLPVAWNDDIEGFYSGTEQNLIVVQYFKNNTYKVQITQPD